MPEPDRLLELLVEWQELAAAGKEPSPEELCPDDPALCIRLKAQIEKLSRLQNYLGDRSTLGGSRSANAEAAPLPKIAGYELLGVLGSGGAGIVYKARHISLKRLVALKMVHSGRFASPHERQRLRQEAEAIAQLQHPQIVQIHEIGEQDHVLYLALEFVPGGSLAASLPTNSPSARGAAQIVMSLARAIHYAHQKGIIHRDLKPANILLSETGEPKIGDFGLAKLLANPSDQTQVGSIVGSPSYMSPEQAAGRLAEIGPPTDVHALGAILYELLTSRPPFKGDSVLDTLDQVRHIEPVSPRRIWPRIPVDLETICLKCLQKDSRRRYATAEELADDLQRFLNDEPIHARPVGVVERSWKWARRRPAIASLLAVLAVVAMTSLSAILWALGKAELALSKSESSRQAETAQKIEAQTSLYFQSIALAQRELENANVASAEQILDRCDPNLRHWEWHYLKRLCHPETLSLAGHEGKVAAVAWSADGTRLASATGEWSGMTPCEIRVWDGLSGASIQVCRGHERSITSLEFLPGDRLVSAGWDGDLRFWDVETGDSTNVVKTGQGAIFDLACSPDGKTVTTVGGQGPVVVWNSETGEKIHEFPVSSVNLFAVGYSPDGRWLAVAGRAGVISIFDLPNKKPHREIIHATDIRALAFSPDGATLATGGYDNVVSLWDWKRGQKILSYTHHLASIASVAFSPDGASVASSDTDSGVKVWDVRTGQTRFDVRGHTGAVASLAFHPAGGNLATGGYDGLVKVVNVELESESRVIGWMYPIAGAISFHPEGKQFVTTYSEDGNARSRRLRIWNVDGKGQPIDVARQTAQFTAVAYSPSGHQIAAASDDGSVKLFEATSNDGGRGSFTESTLPGHAGRANAVAFHPQGTFLASAGADKVVRIHSLEARSEPRILKGDAAEVLGVAYDDSGSFIAACSQDGALQIWNAESGEVVATTQVSSDPVTSLIFSPRSQTLATASGDQRIRLWNLADLIRDRSRTLPRHTLNGHAAAVTGLSFLADGSRIASCSFDRTVKVWDVASGNEALSLRIPGQSIRGVAFGPLGDCLVAHTHQLRIWDGPASSDGAAATAKRVELPDLEFHRQQADSAETDRQWYTTAFHLQPIVEQNPEDVPLLVRYSKVLAEAGQWKQAIAVFDRLIEKEPTNIERIYASAIARLASGDREGYHAMIAAIFRKFGVSDQAGIASVTLYAVAPDPEPRVEREVFLQLGPVAAKYFAGNCRTEGAACYRAGEYAKALDQMRQASASGWRYRSWDLLFLAMIHARLEQPEAARQWLQEAQRWISAADAVESTSAPRIWYHWLERAEVLLLQNEAEQLILGMRSKN